MPDETYDVVTPHLERSADKTGRRGAEWRLGLEKKARGNEVDTRWTSTNVEWMTTDELLALRDEIDRAMPGSGLDVDIHHPKIGDYTYGTGHFDQPPGSPSITAVLRRVSDTAPVPLQYHVVLPVKSVWQAQAIAAILNAE